MSTRTLPYPAELERWMAREMPDMPHVRVIPRDKDGRKCAAWEADCYEVHVCPVATPSPSQFDGLEVALRAWPGCYRVTRVGWEGEPATLTRESTKVYKIADPGWPTKSRASDVYTRPMVWALIGDPEEGSE